jgi:HlyD family secretion protein
MLRRQFALPRGLVDVGRVYGVGDDSNLGQQLQPPGRGGCEYEAQLLLSGHVDLSKGTAIPGGKPFLTSAAGVVKPVTGHWRFSSTLPERTRLRNAAQPAHTVRILAPIMLVTSHSSRIGLHRGSLQVVSRKIRFLLLIFILAIAATGGYFGYKEWQSRQSSNGMVVLYGNVDVREVDLAFNIEGRIAEMLVEEGDAVASGQLLARLETDIYDAEVKVAKARVAASQSALDRLLAGSRAEEIQQASLNEARASLRRTIALESRQFASQQQLDVDRARVQALEAQLEAAKQTLELTIQGPREQDIAEAQAGLEADRASLDLALHRLSYTELYAKNSGIVKTRMVEPGAVVAPQTPVYAVAISDPVWVRTYVSEVDLSRVVPGAKASIYTDSAPGKPYEGWVGYVSPAAEFTPRHVQTEQTRTSLVYQVRVYVSNPDNELRQGMPVTVRLNPETGASAGEAGRQDAG